MINAETALQTLDAELRGLGVQTARAPPMAAAGTPYPPPSLCAAAVQLISEQEGNDFSAEDVFMELSPASARRSAFCEVRELPHQPRDRSAMGNDIT